MWTLKPTSPSIVKAFSYITRLRVTRNWSVKLFRLTGLVQRSLRSHKHSPVFSLNSWKTPLGVRVKEVAYQELEAYTYATL